MTGNTFTTSKPGNFQEGCYQKGRKLGDWHLSFLAFSMGLFLCVTSALIMVTVVSDFALTYQSRNILIEMFDHMFNETENRGGTTPPTTMYSSEITPTDTTFTKENTTSTQFQTSTLGSSTSFRSTFDATPSSVSMSPTTTPSAHTSDTFTSDSNTTTNTIPTTSPSIEKKSPVIILNEVHNNKKFNYTCYETCAKPYIITAKLNVTLSVEETFLYITTQVATDDVRVAKRKAAYLALDYLYEEHLESALVDLEWESPVPSSCVVAGEKTWQKCKKQ